LSELSQLLYIHPVQNDGKHLKDGKTKASEEINSSLLQLTKSSIFQCGFVGL
jgi:hypothetical protein